MATSSIKVNDVLVLKDQLKTKTQTFEKGQQFKVLKGGAKLHIFPMDKVGNIQEIGMVIHKDLIAGLFNKDLAASNAAASAVPKFKKGEIFQFKKDYSNSKEGIYYPKGTKAALIKGGAKPEFKAFYKQKKNPYIDGLIITTDFIKEYFEPIEPVVCDDTKDWKAKNIKDGMLFSYDVYYKNKKVGNVELRDRGGAPYAYIDAPEWTELVAKVAEIYEEVSGSKCRIPEEYLVSFLMDNNGIITLRDYLIYSF